MRETQIDERTETSNTYVLFGVKRLWLVVAAACVFGAAGLGWRGHLDATFVTATLGAVAWFLDLRNLLRARNIETAADENEESEVEESDEQ